MPFRHKLLGFIYQYDLNTDRIIVSQYNFLIYCRRQWLYMFSGVSAENITKNNSAISASLR
jgi:hypothetical protein